MTITSEQFIGAVSLAFILLVLAINLTLCVIVVGVICRWVYSKWRDRL